MYFKQKTAVRLFGVLSVLMIIAVVFYQQENHRVSELEKIRSTSSPKAAAESKIARADYFHQLLRDPATGRVPPAMRESELQYANTLKETSNYLRKAAGNGFLWRFAGPTDVGGRTRALAVDVTNANTLIAGGVSGGIWKSTDRGQTWVLKNTTTQPLSVSWIAQDQRSGHTNTWYYSTGEFLGNSASDRGFTARFYGYGIYKSTDNGETWNILPVTQDPGPNEWNWDFDYVSKIVVSPTTGTIFTANNGMGIYRSDDGGQSFDLELGGYGEFRYADVEVASDGVLVAVISENSAGQPQSIDPGVYKSTDDGLNWTDITPASFPGTHDRSVLAISPSNPDLVYVLTLWYFNNIETFSFHRITISTGASLDRSSNLPDFTSQYYTVLNAQGGYNMIVSVKPDDPNFVVLGLTNLFRSRDGFSTRPTSTQEADVWIGGYVENANYIGQYPVNHPDHHVIAWDPTDPDKMWNGNDGGIYYADDITVSLSGSEIFPWQDKNAGYNVTQFYTASIPDDADDNRIMGGTQDNGTPYFTFDGITTSSSDDVSGGDGCYGYFGQDYAYTSSQLGRLVRLGYTGGDPDWNKYSIITPSNASSQLFVNPFRVDPNNEDVMYYPAGGVFYRNDQLNSIPAGLNSGTTEGWSNISGWSVGSFTISALDISIVPAHMLYYSASSGALKPRIYRVDNATTSTSRELFTLNAAADGAYVHDIAINPDNGAEILIVVSNYNTVSVFHSADSGQTITSVEGNLRGEEITVGSYTYETGPSVRGATILPTDDGIVYLVATSTGVYSTTTLDGNSTIWDQESPDLIGNAVCEYIDSRASDGTVVVGTHGRGIYIGKYDPAASVDKNGSVRPTGFGLAQNYPNPFNPSTTIEFSLPSAGQVSLLVYDINGRQVAELVNEYRKEGSHTVTFNGVGLASGVYIYRIQAGNYTASHKMMLVK